MEIAYEVDATNIDELIELAHFILTRSQEILVANETSDTGFLLRSGQIVIEENRVLIVYDAPYAEFIEFGTEPHKINPYDIIAWAKRKLQLDEDEAISAAFAIANKISKEGTEPQPFLRPAVEEALVRFERAVYQ